MSTKTNTRKAATKAATKSATKAAPVAVPKDKGQPEARLDAIRAAGLADAAASGALVAAIATMARAGACTVEEVRTAWPTCNAAPQYASAFNTGDKAASAIGEARAVKLITLAAAVRVPGGLPAFQCAQLACRAVTKRRKDHGSAPTGHVADKWLREAVDAVKRESQAKADAVAARKLEAKAKRQAERDGATDAEPADGAAAAVQVATGTSKARSVHQSAGVMALNLASVMAGAAKPEKAAGDWTRAVKLAGELAEALAAFRD